MQIGLLEDDTAIQEMLLLVLEDAGYSVHSYPTADACLDALFNGTQGQNTSPIDLLIVDWRLSGSIPGTEVIRTLRANETYSSLPIILTTAATFPNDDELRDMHVALLEKPFAVDDIVNLIKNLV
ncbi:MAG TPA: response regulator [Ktedonobacteraceae bacterium]|nr:response regulator [Ktedonobacteraceae bacterium]